jgi:hypothetical protein
MRVRYVIGAVCGVALCGCSWITDLVVANRSDDPLELLVSVPRHAGSAGRVTECLWPQKGLRGLALSDLSEKAQWKTLEQDQVRYDDSTCVATMTLAPNTGVAIAAVGTYTGNWKRRAPSRLPVESLTLRTPDGSITYTGLELLKRFKRKSDV